VRPAVANLLLAAGSLVLCLGLAEGVARYALREPAGGGKERDEGSQYVVSDPHLGWRKNPGAHVTYRRREYTTDVLINSLGLRDRERTYARPPGVRRVLALGDSFLEGYTVALEQTTTQVAEKALDRPGCPVEVVNAGTQAWSTDQEYLFYKEEGVRYEPQVLLVFLYYNDLFGNIEKKYWRWPKPLLAPGPDGQLLLTNDPVPRLPPPPSPPPAGAQDDEEDHGFHSVAFGWVRSRLYRGAPRAYNALSYLHLWPRMGGETLADDDQLRVFKKRRQALVEDAWSRTEQILQAMAQEARAHGTEFAVVYVPSRMEVSDRDWDLTRLTYDLDEKVWDRGLVAARLSNVGHAHGFPVLDLTPALREHTSALRQPYFVYDGHWNALGHQVAGETVARFLQERGWVPPCAGR
jgi:hypothetical protein